MQTITFDNQSYIAPSWEQMGNLTFDLARKIINANIRIDRIIALAKGGLTWSRTLADYLNVNEVSVTHIRFYTDVKKTANQPIIVQSLPVSVENEHILLFDDVADSGHTLSIAKNYLQMCGAEKIISATLFIKSWAKFLPDYYAETTDAWIIFPHEIREMINLIGKKWGGKYSQDEITQRFITMGMQKDQIKYFLSLQEYNKDK